MIGKAGLWTMGVTHGGIMPEAVSGALPSPLPVYDRDERVVAQMCSECRAMIPLGGADWEDNWAVHLAWHATLGRRLAERHHAFLTARAADSEHNTGLGQ